MSAGQMTGQMGHVHGIDGTQTRGCRAKKGFFFPDRMTTARTIAECQVNMTLDPGKLSAGAKTHPKTKHTQICDFKSVAPSDVFWCRFRGEQRPPESVQHTRKHRFSERSITCVFGGVLFSSEFSGIPKPMVCNWVAFTKTAVITKTAKTTTATQTITNKRVECWESGNHRNHENDENHANPGCKASVPWFLGSPTSGFRNAIPSKWTRRVWVANCC